MPLLVVELDQELLGALRRYAVEKHGRIHGVLKPEVELALRNHLAKQVERTSLKEAVER
jgi:hypothetical protein